eukprot:CAMPEP_0177779488 /NCGR_PEP_ID=MMETSP0491_2-20121128/16616_1 /TAXON_ID=63592 /ORGANISM="Tetraselmis chuii, Strain PLY429" /LENGTH=84 /DNA_ID=CAMNT_0019299035 /DNA_START=1 /DNA_END=252 /DNA_ORIENTATION=+
MTRETRSSTRRLYPRFADASNADGDGDGDDSDEEPLQQGEDEAAAGEESDHGDVRVSVAVGRGGTAAVRRTSSVHLQNASEDQN